MSFLSSNEPLRFIRRGFERIQDHRAANISFPNAVVMLIDQAAQRRRLQKLALSVLPRYGLRVDRICFINDSVNTVFQVEADGVKYALRIHPPHRHSTEEIQAELSWLLALRTDTSLRVPEPVPTKDGTLVQEVSFSKTPHSRQIVLFKWLDGAFLKTNLSPITLELAGSLMARLHHHAKQFKLPEGVSRQHINWAEPLQWDEPWVWLDENHRQSKALTQDDYKLCVATANAVLEKIAAFTLDTDYGLVHLDLHPGNYLLRQGEIQAMDFDDCCYAPFLYDMAVPLSSLDERQDYEDLKAAFLSGYTRERRLPPHHEAGLELFMAVRALDRIAWVLSWPSPSHKKRGKKLLAISLRQLRRWIRTKALLET